mmetsp:Transcript_443/g.670  ORF Transcript_443/g.670 Transcript_443/m.670 type:complete len:661 (+) Transcript_443:331-2313(+)
MPSSLSRGVATNNDGAMIESNDAMPKRMTVNISLCGSIPRSTISSLHPHREASAEKNDGRSIQTGHLTVTLNNHAEQSRLPLRVPNLNMDSLGECTSPFTKPSTSTIAPRAENQDENNPVKIEQTARRSRPKSEKKFELRISSRTDQMQTDQQLRHNFAPFQCAGPHAKCQPPAITLQPRVCLRGVRDSNSANECQSASNSTLQRDQPPSLPSSMQSQHEEPVPAPQPTMEPPSWAVPAKGHAKLEPVCDTARMHPSVDLTRNSHFRVGRSPASDVQLLHSTSSRRHAMLFHHPNGSCYVVDCGSAHGTYVNGVRVKSTFPSAPSAGDRSSTGRKSVVVPHRVRRGALIRFGGPGAPSFILKSFAVGIEGIVGHVTHADCESMETPSCLPTLAPSSPKPHLEGAKRCVASSTDLHDKKSTLARDLGSLILLNTRLNAIGGAAALALEARKLARVAMTKLGASFSDELRKHRHLGQTCEVDRKRPRAQCADDERASKRIKSILLCPLSPNPSMDRLQPCLISPPTYQNQSQKTLFPPSAYTLTPAQCSLSMNHIDIQECVHGFSPILTPSPMRGSSRGTKHRRRVQFSYEKPECVYPQPVTPDEFSTDEEKDNKDRISDNFSEHSKVAMQLNAPNSNTTLNQKSRTVVLPPTTPRVVSLSA